MSSDQVGSQYAVAASREIGWLRLAIGLLQGVAAWRLLKLVPPTYPFGPPQPQNLSWSEQHPMLFAALTLVTAFVPVIAMAGISRLRRRSLAAYLGLAAIALAGLAAYDLWRDPLQQVGALHAVRVWPSFELSFGAAVGLFIVNQLIEHRERGHSLWTHYAEHFEDSWMRGFQLVGSLIFSLLVWGVLNLGAALFNLIHVAWFETLIQHNWFRCPALAMAFAAAIHITDVRPALLKGMRNVVLTLLSWLLPLVVLVSAAFLIALLVVGLTPLWATRFAASILLSACAVTLFLLNAAYKDGDPGALPSGPVRWAGRICGPIMLVLALLASYAIALRVQQYGWTPERVLSAAVAFVALIYSGGFSYATASRAGWLAPLERVNVFASLVIVAVLVSLLTPLADPERVSVASQLARLTRGRVAPDRFDFEFLRFGGGRFGRRALEGLTASANADIRSRATRMLAASERQPMYGRRGNAAATEAAFTHATVYPTGVTLPADFKSVDWAAAGARNPDCLRNGGYCEIYLSPDASADQVAVIVRPVSADDARPIPDSLGSTAWLFQKNGNGQWTNMGFFSNLNCPGVVAVLRQGTEVTAPPEHPDLMANGVRLRFSALYTGMSACTPAPVRRQDLPGKPRDPHGPPQLGPAFGSPAG